MTTPLAVARTGSELAIAAVLLNGVCAALIALWPAESISFANSWMHGVDLQLIRATAPLTLGGFFYGVIALAATSFVVGVAYAWVYNALHKLGRADEVLK
jgi:uncharacterized protein DUF5676